MNTGHLDLPVIWRGCNYRRVEIAWNDKDGNPIDLTGWLPRAYSRYFTFHSEILDAENGLTAISLPPQGTSNLKLGVTNWDFVWAKDDEPFTVSGPFLKGTVEVKQPVTDPHTHVEGRIGGGSNYIKMFPERIIGYRYMNVVGLYHRTWPQPSPPSFPYPPPVPDPVEVRPTAQEQLAQMRANGQTKITILFYFEHAYLDVTPANRIAWEYCDGLPLIPFNPSGIEGDVDVRLTLQQEQNLYDLMDDIRDAGFTQLNIRFVPFLAANNFNWPDPGREEEGKPRKRHFWIQDRYLHNRNYIFSIIRMVESHKGEFITIYDLGAESANDRLGRHAFHPEDQPAHDVHRRYCRFLWSAYTNEFDKHGSMAFSVVGGQFNPAQTGYDHCNVGTLNLLALLKQYHLPYPGFYGADLYGDADNSFVLLQQMLVDTYDFTRDNYPGEESKPFIIQETLYNDIRVFNQIKVALDQRPHLNLHSVFQWPRIRGHPDSNDYIFPDGFPMNYYNYHTL